MEMPPQPTMALFQCILQTSHTTDEHRLAKRWSNATAISQCRSTFVSFVKIWKFQCSGGLGRCGMQQSRTPKSRHPNQRNCLWRVSHSGSEHSYRFSNSEEHVHMEVILKVFQTKSKLSCSHFIPHPSLVLLTLTIPFSFIPLYNSYNSRTHF